MGSTYSTTAKAGAAPPPGLDTEPSVCSIVYTTMAHFRALFSPSSLPPPPILMTFLDRSSPNEHAAVNCMPKFALGQILRLVKNRHLWLQDGVLLLLRRRLRTTIFDSCLRPNQTSQPGEIFCGALLYQPQGRFCSFFKISIFSWKNLFFRKNT